jgi:hypothetical protein
MNYNYAFFCMRAPAQAGVQNLINESFVLGTGPQPSLGNTHALSNIWAFWS